ncbi:MAG: VOC family protein [Terriglobales bacterium]
MGAIAAGSFCWVELATPNPAEAQQFYKKLFGWEAQQPPDAKHQYTLLARDGAIAAGCFQLPEELRKQNVPPHWLVYVATANADDCATRAAELGGKVVRAPFDAQDVGRLAVIQDPTGAVFAVWQAIQFSGFAARGNNAFCWADLVTPDAARAGEFYGELFGWRLWKSEKDSSGYIHINNGETTIGGVPPASEHEPQAPPHWLTWFQVADCDASVEDAESAGARTLMRPSSMERVGRISIVQDPQGAALGLITPAPR